MRDSLTVWFNGELYPCHTIRTDKEGGRVKVQYKDGSTEWIKDKDMPERRYVDGDAKKPTSKKQEEKPRETVRKRMPAETTNVPNAPRRTLSADTKATLSARVGGTVQDAIRVSVADLAGVLVGQVLSPFAPNLVLECHKKQVDVDAKCDEDDDFCATVRVELLPTVVVDTPHELLPSKRAT